MTNIDDTIYRVNRIKEEEHTEENAKQLGLPYLNLSAYPIVPDVLNLVPEQIAVKAKAIPYLKIGSQVKVGLVEPADATVKELLGQIERTAGIKFAPTLISKSSFIYGISMYEKERQAKLEKEKIRPADEDNYKITDIKSAAEAAKKVNITKLLDLIIEGALSLKASDIHVEPEEADFLIRYRIDGVLQDVVKLPPPQYKQLISRIKFLSKLRMDISDKPQDGRFSIKFKEQNIDLRVSLMPSAYGESVVLRILGQERSILQLDLLGFRPDALAVIKNAVGRPHGMVINSGPTGSGKSSTLYAILTELKKPGVKIITLEDPVEFKIEGIEQSQINMGGGYTFAEGLRASMRQDPDILMIGEIRDLETAEIAVQAALTGHLLLSTIHANSAPAVFARLLEIGVKPFLLAGSINLIMAQRLVRKICPNCREEYAPEPDVWAAIVQALTPYKNRLSVDIAKKIELPADQARLFRGKGCEKCNTTGYIGRQIIVEVLVPDDKIEALIAKGGTISDFEKVAVEMGMITMEADGLSRVLEGSTTVDEVWRVTRA